MIILHGGLLEESLFLWGETPLEDEPASRNGRGSGTKPQPYPYAASFDSVARAVRGLPLSFRPTKRRLQTALAWLPTQGSHALPSSELLGEAPASRAKVKLAPWQVEGLALDAGEALELLVAYGQRASSAHRLLGGRDLQFWLRALKLAGSMAARQRYLPGVESRDDDTRALWIPVWIGDDTRRLEQLASHMPGSARALTQESCKQPPETPGTEVLANFVSIVVDRLARTVEPGPVGGPQNGRAAAAAGIQDRWLDALRREDAVLRGDPEERKVLGEQLREWRRPIDLAANAPFRLCFRLEEPASAPEPRRNTRGRRNTRARNAPRAGQRRWYVRYLLQATDDPTLLVPTADAWITRGRKAASLSRMGTDLHETLLSSLAQASGVCPRIEESLRSRKPSGYSLDARGAYEFLTETSPALEQAGFGTLLPSWWQGHDTEHSLSVRARVRTPDEAPEWLNLDEVVRFDWEVCLGGKSLSGRELEELARLKEPLQLVRGHWAATAVDEIHAALEFWKNRKAGAVSAREIVRMALGSADTSAGIRFDGVRATGWLQDLLSRLEDKERIEPIPTPPGFVGELRPYQERGYAWLDFLRGWGLGACLADDMGLGKTIQTLALVQRERQQGEDRPVLLVCPTSVIANWQHEAARFTPKLAVTVHHGTGRAKGWDFVQQAQDQALVITSYALLHRDLDDVSTVQWSGVVLDEAQNVKNANAKQSKAAREIRADYRLALTGTPVENHVGDLWSIMDFLNPGLLGSDDQFKKSFFVPIQAHRDREAAERLQRITGPFILRRLKTDRSIISDLPDKLEMKVYCTLTREQGGLYEQVVEDAEKKIRDASGIERRGVILAALTKLKQVCNHPAHLLSDESELEGRSGKLTRLSEMLEEVVETGDRSLVFTQYAEMGGLLQEHLQDKLGREVLYLHGGTPKRRRDAMVAHFQSADDDVPPVFVLSLKAGGTGLNLTGANHVFHFDRWWNPAVENQATDRAFRIGQQRNVQVHKFVCAGTLEERIDGMIERKKSIAEDIVGTGENWITELSDDELHQVFALGADAVRD